MDMRNFDVRNIQPEDANILREIAIDNPPLEGHTPYTYWVMCSYSNRCSFVLTLKDEMAGYIMCVENDDCIFIWQLCILPKFRGHHYAHILLSEVFDVAKTKNKVVEMAIEEGNEASLKSFKAVCEQYGCKLSAIGEVKNNTQAVEIIYRIEF